MICFFGYPSLGLDDFTDNKAVSRAEIIIEAGK